MDLDTKRVVNVANLSVLASRHRQRGEAHSDRRRASDWANAAVVALVLSAEKGALEWHLSELA
jgi:hypothetical protein